MLSPPEAETTWRQLRDQAEDRETGL